MLKKLASERLRVPEEQQHLLFFGQLLPMTSSSPTTAWGPMPPSVSSCGPQRRWCLRRPVSASPCSTIWAKS